MITDAQKHILITAVWGLAENAEESLGSGDDPTDYGVEHKDDFTWDMAVKHGIATLHDAVNDEGIQGAMDSGYLFDEDQGGHPTGLEKLNLEAVKAFLMRLKAERTADGKVDITEAV